MSSATDGGSAYGDRTGGERELTLTTVGCVRGQGGELGVVAAEFRYRPRDCLAVTLVLGAADEERVTWTFAWDLLVQGQMRPAGEGDVRIRPMHHRLLRCVEVALAPSFGVRIRVPAPDVDTFLSAVRAREPRDAGHVAQALDAELAVIMAQT